MIGAAIASAAMKCHPMSTIKMILSSSTLVDAISTAMAAVKFAPLRKIDRAIAMAA
jgi:hypothetical protein